MNTKEEQKNLVKKTIDYTQELMYQLIGMKSLDWTVGVYDLENLGECDYIQESIRYNNVIFENNDFDTIKFLVAHEVVHITNRNENHGKNWKKTVKQLGGIPTILRWNQETKVIVVPNI